jgi:hypothetical protein
VRLIGHYIGPQPRRNDSYTPHITAINRTHLALHNFACRPRSPDCCVVCRRRRLRSGGVMCAMTVLHATTSSDLEVRPALWILSTKMRAYPHKGIARCGLAFYNVLGRSAAVLSALSLSRRMRSTQQILALGHVEFSHRR